MHRSTRVNTRGRGYPQRCPQAAAVGWLGLPIGICSICQLARFEPRTPNPGCAYRAYAYSRDRRCALAARHRRRRWAIQRRPPDRPGGECALRRPIAPSSRRRVPALFPLFGGCPASRAGSTRAHGRCASTRRVPAARGRRSRSARCYDLPASPCCARRRRGSRACAAEADRWSTRSRRPPRWRSTAQAVPPLRRAVRSSSFWRHGAAARPRPGLAGSSSSHGGSTSRGGCTRSPDRSGRASDDNSSCRHPSTSSRGTAKPVRRRAHRGGGLRV
jgi:hypothetical protein